MKDLVLISTFTSVEDSTEPITVLTDYGIQYDLRSSDPTAHATFGLNAVENSIELYVQREDAERALHLLKIETYDPETLTTEGYDGYLLHFTDDELLEVIVQSGDWANTISKWPSYCLQIGASLWTLQKSSDS